MVLRISTSQQLLLGHDNVRHVDWTRLENEEALARTLGRPAGPSLGGVPATTASCHLRSSLCSVISRTSKA